MTSSFLFIAVSPLAVPKPAKPPASFCRSGTTQQGDHMTTGELPKTGQLPPIMIPAGDYRRLTALMDAAERAPTPVVEFLAQELSRAEIVDDEQCQHVVRVGSLVSYRDGVNGRYRTVRIVWPLEADVNRNRISVLSPVGAALLGMSPGQSIEWPRPVGEPRTLTVLAVYGEDTPDPAA
jgi:regulator of nucleoside diphosphate kinase